MNKKKVEQPIIKIENATGRACCKGPNCSKLPMFITPLTDKIVKGTTTAVISLYTGASHNGNPNYYQNFYCQECINWLKNEFNVL